MGDVLRPMSTEISMPTAYIESPSPSRPPTSTSLSPTPRKSPSKWKINSRSESVEIIPKCPTPKEILSFSRSSPSDVEDELIEQMDAVKLLSLSRQQFTFVGEYMTLCSRILVLDLSGNFLSSMAPLAACTNLLKLDLHDNHISDLPDGNFWKQLKRLQILYLHGNAIGGRKSLQQSVESLAACPRLRVLTLYDTPISVSRTYRHHVTNLILSLQGLDGHVIADSEVIEGARFPGRFAAQSQALALSMYKPAEPELWRELASITLLVLQVEKLQRKHSPIQTIQRFWRSVRKQKKFKAPANNINILDSPVVQGPPQQPQSQQPGTTSIPPNQKDAVLRTQSKPEAKQEDILFKVNSDKLMNSVETILQRTGTHPDINSAVEDLEIHPAQSETLQRKDLLAAFGTPKSASARVKPFSSRSLNTIATKAINTSRSNSAVAIPTGTLSRIPTTQHIDSDYEQSRIAASAPTRTIDNALQQETHTKVYHLGNRQKTQSAMTSRERHHHHVNQTADELRRFHEVLRLAMSEQRKAEIVEKKEHTASLRSQQLERTIKSSLTRTQNNVSHFLRPLINHEAHRLKQKVATEIVNEKLSKVTEVQVDESIGLMKRHMYTVERQKTSQKKNQAHVEAVANAKKAQAQAQRDKYVEREERYKTKMDRLEAIREQRATRIAKLSRINKEEAEQRHSINKTTKNELLRSNYTQAEIQRMKTKFAREDLLQFLDNLRKAKSKERLKKRSDNLRKAAQKKELQQQSYRVIVAKARGDRQRALTLDEKHHTAKSRERLTHRGLKGIPIAKALTQVPVASHLYDEPGENRAVEIDPAPVKAFPQKLRGGMPRSLVHASLVEEFEERWQAIGSFCKSELCRIHPTHSCDACFPKFREFVQTDEVILKNSPTTETDQNSTTIQSVTDTYHHGNELIATIPIANFMG
eukprot:m.112961 g.112961  ORF g.112961 m.112961 type:complete len:928 (-) comp14115_c0_seq2:39-2822(-)